ncbi:T9SS type A sorting domain-containing protein [Cryomorpha ignava]|uniref:T9SS type A sorting domain-containing protein n=1 Tax=Cryomorpha ignava TaxID=101383 RepID=A0A7K3WLX1_9FLAO|nr:M43 family zinc metalloprotease [Cryomorpha ignava]NEN22464.1 T9SS type A sorting domain-containing protein [Cryomorpha ignava]
MRHYLTILSLFAFTCIFGQESEQTPYGDFNEHTEDQCAHTDIHERLMLQNPQYRAEQEAQQIAIENLVEQYKSGMVPKTGTIHTVPVVVHIIHKGEAIGTGSNISDEQVYSAINALNQDYRKMIGTAGDGDGADIEVEFCLAQRDPNGNASTGINRISGCSVTDYCTEGITAGNGQGASETSVKNLSRWPNQQYYNIWVVTEIEDNNGGSGIQGYAYFPTTSIVDGTVLLYNAFGTIGALKSYTNKNKTLTHEIGHAFALFHTFQGGTCTETNCTMQGDRVCDTPPTTLNSNCNNPACGGTQQVENYMDYTSQNCKNMFSEGQKLRMRAALENSRINLINSNGCEPITVTQADASIIAITKPVGNSCINMIQPVVTLTNVGSVNLNNVTIQYKTTGSWQNYSWTGLLGQNQSVDVTLPVYNGGWGQQTLYARTNLPNGSTDANSSNDQSTAGYNAVQNGHTLTLNIVKDVLGGQTTWLIRNSANETIASGGPYANFQSGTIETEIVCVDNGCYDFVIMDIMGDGICCENGNGSYTLEDENDNLLASGGDFGTQETTNFCFSSGGDPPVANFSAASTNICEGGSTTFTNLTTGDVDSYEWKFFGGSPFTVTGANPGTITYNTPGTYNVRLIATNQFGNDIELKSDYITVGSVQTWYADTDNDGHGDPNATIESCAQPTGYVTLGDDCNDNNGGDWNSCYDCLNVMNGTAELDNCGICDSNANNDCVQDCAGAWGGNAVMDNCGVCDSNSNNDCVQDCAGVWGGNAVMDNCGVCDSNPNNNCVQDCAGVWGGNAVIDNCEVCDSNPNNDCVQDCAGVWGGSAYIDNCGTCDSNSNNDCVQDCAGVWGGDAAMDNCGVCDSNPNNDCVQDCAGVWGGNAVIDNCEVCDSNPNNDCVQDCAGVWGGSAYLDNCGTCDSNSNNDCVQDCAGVWGGEAYYDDCGTCDNIIENDCILCEGVGITLISSLSPTCNGSENGEINITVSTVSNDYTLTWNNGMTGTVLTGLGSGTYQASLVEGECTAFLQVVLTEPAALLIAVQSIENDDCDDNPAGAASISVSGGTEPYIVTLNNVVITNMVLNSLSADTYVIDVLDGNSCSASANFTIEQMSCDSLSETQVEASICEQQNVGFYDSVNCQPVENVLNYAWELRRLPDLDNPINFTTTIPSFSGSDIPALIPGMIYQIRVKGVNPLIPSDFGSACELQFAINESKLISGDCGNLNLMIEDIVTATSVQGATDYEFRFENPITLARLYYYSDGESSCPLADVEDLELEVEYNVLVRAKYRNIWGEYGENCIVKVIPFIETTALTDEWCENYSINLQSDIILLQPIENASVYEIRISNEAENFEANLQSNQPEFSAISLEGVTPETYYQAQARALKEGAWTPWGEICNIAFGNPEILKLNMFIFPNPGSYGKQVNLQTKGDWENIIIEISDTQGHGLEKFKSDFKNLTPKELNISNFKPGMYFLHITHGKQTLSKKLLIQ